MNGIYCESCGVWNQIHHYSDSFGSDSYTYEEDEMSGSSDDDWIWQEQPTTSILKRKRSLEFTDPNPRPRKKLCMESDIDRSDAPVYAAMDVDK